MQYPRYPKERGFTLIEILTVIGVIAILAAILIPVTSSVRDRAKLTKSISKLRQFHTAAGLYSGDNQGRLVPAQGWYTALFDYYGRTGLSFGEKFSETTVWDFLANPAYDYAWHPNSEKSQNNSPNRFGYGMNANPLTPDNPSFFYGQDQKVPAIKITNLSSRPMFGEANNVTISYAGDGSTFFEGGPYNTEGPGIGSEEDVFHDGLAAYVMFDGSVQQLSPEDALLRLSQTQ